jgi:hypothetical protein
VATQLHVQKLHVLDEWSLFVLHLGQCTELQAFCKARQQLLVAHLQGATTRV